MYDSSGLTSQYQFSVSPTFIVAMTKGWIVIDGGDVEIKADRHLQGADCPFDQNWGAAAVSPWEWRLCTWSRGLGFIRCKGALMLEDSICNLVLLWSQMVDTTKGGVWILLAEAPIGCCQWSQISYSELLSLPETFRSLTLHKVFDKNNLGKNGAVLVYSLRVHSIEDRKTWWWENGAANHIDFPIRNQKEISAGTPWPFFLLFSAGLVHGMVLPTFTGEFSPHVEFI